MLQKRAGRLGTGWVTYEKVMRKMQVSTRHICHTLFKTPK
jgi:hypothetical protein